MASKLTMAVGLALTVMIARPPRRAGAAVTQTYVFRDDFQALEGGGNALVPVSNATASIVTSGPDFLNGAFVDETISASACATQPTIRAWSFPTTAGLRYDNTSPQIVTGSYSISMLMRYNPMDSGYARLIDFSNSTLDTGIYKVNAGVSFFPGTARTSSAARSASPTGRTLRPRASAARRA
jgi:hypothetical protein